MSNTISAPYELDVVYPPGETLVELLDELEMSQAELAKRTGLSTKLINQIVKGGAAITAETALLLERATGAPAVEWSNLEGAYRVHQSRMNEEARLAEDLGWLDQLPVKEMISRGCIEHRDRPVDVLREVCNFFGVANRTAWDLLWQKPTAYRRSKAFSSDPGAVAAWLRIGELRASQIECGPFNRQGLMGQLNYLRSLTIELQPSTWVPQLEATCAEFGVAVVFEPEISGARIAGAARWLTPDKALVQLSLRHKWSDIFWFTFFHELGHLLLHSHSKKEVFINDQGPHSGAEQEADAFASQLLIPRPFEARLGELANESDVEAFANEIGVGSDVVVGRLQFERRWPYNKGTRLKRRFKFIGESN